MMNKFTYPTYFLAIVFVITIFSGCTANYSRFSPESPEQIKKIKRIGLLTPEINIREISAGGSSIVLGEHTATSRKYFIENTKKIFEKKGIEVKFIDLSGQDSLRFIEPLAMYRTINNAILQKDPSETRNNFQFEIGSLDSLSALYEVDGFLFLSGYDLKSSTSRVFAETALVAVGGLGASEKRSLLCLGIADKSGKLLFHSYNNEPDIWIFTREQSVKDLMIKVTRDYTRKL
ncbi:MAG: hypothetical protein LCH54_05150 [Bacteroidetes bacterium]|nr:hypothetical protein [Bacteroidota bacterium]